MFNEQLAKIEKAKADIAAAEAKLSADRVAALAKLPADFGYDNLNAFIKAVKASYGKGGKGKPGRKAKVAAAAKAPKAAKKGKRAKITDEIKAQVKALAEGGKTGQEIAKALGISAPSVQNIKKAFGMVKARSSAAAPAAAAPAEAVAEQAPAV